MKVKDLVMENEEQYSIYFDYTGAGRGPEIVAGPFPSKEAAKNYAVDEMEIDLTDKNYFIDIHRE